MKMYLLRIYCIFVCVGYIISLIYHLYTYRDIILYDIHPYLFWIIVIIGILSNLAIKFFLLNSKLVVISITNPQLMMLRILRLFSIVYGICNIFACQVVMKFGEPIIYSNKYVILRHGDIIQVLTNHQYLIQKIYQFRLNSGYVLWFYVIAIYFITDIITKQNEKLH